MAAVREHERRMRDHQDDEAWREFERRYRDLIVRYCLKRGLQRNDAEDVRQMVLLNLARQLLLRRPQWSRSARRSRRRARCTRAVRR